MVQPFVLTCLNNCLGMDYYSRIVGIGKDHVILCVWNGESGFCGCCTVGPNSTLSLRMGVQIIQRRGR